MQKTLSPLCGINREIGFVSRSKNDPKLIITGGDLVGVHTILKRPDPGRGGYHVGGTGNFKEEAMIKNLGESLERYAQLISDYIIAFPKRFCSYRDLERENERVIDKKNLQHYAEEQLSRPNFLFKRFDEDQSLSWVKLPSVIHKESIWVPTQFVFLGYNVDYGRNEPWLTSAVTTGTAVHPIAEIACKSSLLEIIQIDAAMGHWYSSQVAQEIVFDERVAVFKTYLDKTLPPHSVKPRFYWLPNADLPGFTTACIFENTTGGLPMIAIGLGCEANLNESLHKSFLEGHGVVGLARLNIMKMQGQENQNFHDLDSNVVLYALGKNKELIHRKFSREKKIKASSLPKDMTGDTKEICKTLVRAFEQTGKELFITDLTSMEAKQCDLFVTRAWSPDLLPLCLPGCVQKQNPRFKDYGGVTHEEPHPYP